MRNEIGIKCYELSFKVRTFLTMNACCAARLNEKCIYFQCVNLACIFHSGGQQLKLSDRPDSLSKRSVSCDKSNFTTASYTLYPV